MDTLTHALTGAVISNLGFKKEVPGATFTLVAASAMPDIDWASRFFGVASYLKYHRSFTHSLSGIIFLAIILTLVVGVFFKRTDLGKIFLLSLFAGLFHLLMDLINPYGTQIFYPFTCKRYAWNWVTVVDLYITVPLLVSLLLVKSTHLSPSKTASVALAFVVLFILSKGICHQVASKEINEICSLQAQASELEVYPDFFSPLVWKGVVETERAYQVVRLNITRPEWSVSQNYTKLRENEFTVLARRSPLVETYLRFARHPQLFYQEFGGYYFVSWQDLRFGLKGRQGMVVEVILNDVGEIRLERFSFSDPKLHPQRVKRLIEKVAAPPNSSQK